MYQLYYKPLLDFFISLATIIVLLPVFIVLTLILAIYHRGNPFFVHPRVGKDEATIKVIKFRTSSDSPGHDGTLNSDTYKKKPFENFLRRSSLEHLPQFFYVLTGKMSLVGPRPLLTEYLPLYSREQYRRHEVRPGITGWAQINGRNAISWPERFKLDVWYVDHVSFRLDLCILLLTIGKVIKGEGINQPGNSVAERFIGNVPEEPPLMIDLRPFKKVYRKDMA